MSKIVRFGEYINTEKKLEKRINTSAKKLIKAKYPKG